MPGPRRAWSAAIVLLYLALWGRGHWPLFAFSRFGGDASIVLTRQAGENGKLKSALEEALRERKLSADLVEVPCIEHAMGPDFEAMKAYLSSNEPLEMVLLTSPEAARVFGDAARSRPSATPLRVASVGKGTSVVARSLSLEVVFEPSKANAETMALELPEELGPKLLCPLKTHLHSTPRRVKKTTLRSSSRPFPFQTLRWPSLLSTASHSSMFWRMEIGVFYGRQEIDYERAALCRRSSSLPPSRTRTESCDALECDEKDGQYVQTLTEKLPSIFGAQDPIFGSGLECHPPLLQDPVTQLWLGTLMSVGPNDEGHIELKCQVSDLQISIKGPPEKATEFLRKVLALGSSNSGGSPTASVGSFDLISSRAPDSPRPALPRSLETRAQIESSFQDCPSEWLRKATRLGGSAVSGQDRVKRAWRAGQWGGAVLAGRVGSPNRSSQIDLRPRFYAILRADSIDRPTLCSSATSYWRIIGDLEGSNPVSHSFPSELEARTYLSAAGFSSFEAIQ
eukprot:s1965_g14.t1